MRELITAYADPRFTRSELERRFTALCRDHDIPLPSQNVHLHGYEVDACWPEYGLVVELDGLDFHRTRRALERDNLRDAVLAAAGLHVVRLGWREVAQGTRAGSERPQPVAAPPVKRIEPVRSGGHTTPVANRRP